MKKNLLLAFALLFTSLIFSQEKFINKSVEFFKMINDNVDNKEIRKLVDSNISDSYFNSELNKFIIKYEKYNSKINYDSRSFKLSDSLIVDVLIFSIDKKDELGILRFLYINEDELIDNFVFLESKIIGKKNEDLIEDLPPKQ